MNNMAVKRMNLTFYSKIYSSETLIKGGVMIKIFSQLLMVSALSLSSLYSMDSMDQSSQESGKNLSKKRSSDEAGLLPTEVIQDATGSRTISWNSVFKWASGTAPTLSTAASAKDFFTFRSDGTNLYEVGRSLGVA